MKFLILFIAVALHYQFPRRAGDNRTRGFQRWLGFWRNQSWFPGRNPDIRFLIVVVVPALLFAVLFFWLDDFAWGLPAAVLEVVLLYLVLAEVGLGRDVEDYREALMKGDIQGAFLCAERSLALPGLALSSDAATMNSEVMRAVLYRWFEAFFLMLFWYMLADVPGVVLAWLTLHYSRSSWLATPEHPDKAGAEEGDPALNEQQRQADDDAVFHNPRAACYLHWLEWIPVRLLGLTYCLAGNMLTAWPAWHSRLWNTGLSSEKVLTEVAEASLSFNAGQRKWHSIAEDGAAAAEEMAEWQSLHLRSLSVWLVMIAIATIGGWLL